MEQGVIDVGSLPGGFDLQSTVESGQSYLWSREDGTTYETADAYGGSEWYWTTVRHPDRDDPAVLRVRQVDGRLEWESHVDAADRLRHRLRLDDDLGQIVAQTPDDRLLRDAYETY